MTKQSLDERIDMEDVYAITNNLVFKHEWVHGGELTATAYKQNDDGSLTRLDDAIVELLNNLKKLRDNNNEEK